MQKETISLKFRTKSIQIDLKVILSSYWIRSIKMQSILQLFIEIFNLKTGFRVKDKFIYV